MLYDNILLVQEYKCSLLVLQKQFVTTQSTYGFCGEARQWLSVTHLYVELEGCDGLLQHPLALFLGQLDAVHAAPVQLLEEAGAAHGREREERQTLSALQAQGLLGYAPQHLPSRKVSEVTSVGVGNQLFRVLLPNLCLCKEENKLFRQPHQTVLQQHVS